MGPTDLNTYGTMLRPRILALVAGVFLLLASLACSQGSPAAVTSPRLAGTPGPSPTEIRAVAVASVLVIGVPVSVAPSIDRIDISPVPIVLEPGETIRLSARAFGPSGS